MIYFTYIVYLVISKTSRLKITIDGRKADAAFHSIFFFPPKTFLDLVNKYLVLS
jgi:hypothetical protein